MWSLQTADQAAVVPLRLATPALLVQVSLLSRLTSLVLQGTWLAEGFDMCTALASLRSLHLLSVWEVPSCLSTLTGLQHLAVVSEG